MKSDNEVFISYSHKDKFHLQRLLTHLSPHIHHDRIAIWCDQDIPEGTDWRSAIDASIARSSVAVLLVSSDFLASHFIRDYELPLLEEKAALGALRLLWVCVRACSFEVTPLARLQALSSPDKPLDALTKAARERSWTHIAKTISQSFSMPAVRRRSLCDLPARVTGDWDYQRIKGFGYTVRSMHYDGLLVPIVLGGKVYRNAIHTHPHHNGEVNVEYDIGNFGFAEFSVNVGVADYQKYGPATPLTFEILGDGVTRWTSPPVRKWGIGTLASVSVPGVVKLQLRVKCPGDASFARGVWCDPILS